MTTERPTAKSIRMFADAELEPPQASEVEAYLGEHQEHQRWVDFERTLRERVGDSMRQRAPAAPPGLAQRIRSALADPHAAEGSAEAAESVEGGPTSPTAGPGDDRPLRVPWFAGPRRASIFAMAASLALVAGVVLWGIFGRPIHAPPPALELASTAA